MLIARLEPPGAPPAGPQLGFAGVGKPWKIERALTAAGCDLVDFVPLADHADLSDERRSRFLAAPRRDARRRSRSPREKDWVRLPPAWRERVTAWPVRARFEDEAALDALLASAVGGN